MEEKLAAENIEDDCKEDGKKEEAELKTKTESQSETQPQTETESQSDTQPQTETDSQSETQPQTETVLDVQHVSGFESSEEYHDDQEDTGVTGFLTIAVDLKKTEARAENQSELKKSLKLLPSSKETKKVHVHSTKGTTIGTC